MFGWLLNLHKCFGSGRAQSPEPESQPPVEQDAGLPPPTVVVEESAVLQQSGEQAKSGEENELEYEGATGITGEKYCLCS